MLNYRRVVGIIHKPEMLAFLHFAFLNVLPGPWLLNIRYSRPSWFPTPAPMTMTHAGNINPSAQENGSRKLLGDFERWFPNGLGMGFDCFTVFVLLSLSLPPSPVSLPLSMHECVNVKKYIHSYKNGMHTYITLHFITWNFIHYMNLHYITLHYISLHYITLHYIYIYIYITLHWHLHLHYITLHIIYIYIYIYGYIVFQQPEIRPCDWLTMIPVRSP